MFCLIWERYVLNWFLLEHLIPRFKKRFRIKSNKKFKLVEEKIRQDDWPFGLITYGHAKLDAGKYEDQEL